MKLWRRCCPILFCATPTYDLLRTSGGHYIALNHNKQTIPPPPISGFFLALLSGLDATNTQTEHYMNFITARPLLNTYEDILNISSSELEGEMFKYFDTKDMYPNSLILETQ